MFIVSPVPFVSEVAGTLECFNFFIFFCSDLRSPSRTSAKTGKFLQVPGTPQVKSKTSQVDVKFGSSMYSRRNKPFLSSSADVAHVPLLLLQYAAFLLVVFVVLLGSGISGYAYRERLKTGYEDGLNRAFTEYERSSTLTAAVDNLQNTIHCCGIHNVSDWLTTPYGQSNDRAYPISCCKDVVDGVCMSVYNQGCYYTVIHLLESNAGIVIISAFSFAAFQVVGVVLACCLARNINKARYEQV
ncbi:tetraspanin-6-like [Oratosquilla oratoria]|uniref:tetraspanin-6-like n=1 Tax=Oratosquilla oratoria TaxID=337810 RepID=UPI003F76FEDE